MKDARRYPVSNSVIITALMLLVLAFVGLLIWLTIKVIGMVL